MDIIYVEDKTIKNDNINVIKSEFVKDDFMPYILKYRHNDCLTAPLNILIKNIPLSNRRFGAYQLSDKSAMLPIDHELDNYKTLEILIKSIRKCVIDKIAQHIKIDNAEEICTKKIYIEMMHKNKICKISKLGSDICKKVEIKTIDEFNMLLKDYRFNNKSSFYMTNLIISFRCYLYRRDEKICASFTPYTKLIEMYNASKNKAFSSLTEINQNIKIVDLDNVLVL